MDTFQEDKDKDQHQDTTETPEISKRYEITLSRKVIIYAENGIVALSRAVAYAHGPASTTGQGWGFEFGPIDVGTIQELPLPIRESQGLIIDRAPAREGRK